MKKTWLIRMSKIFVLVGIFNLIGINAYSHSGRTDGSGGHHNRSNGTYHYHHGYSAHQHVNGVCPYNGGGTSYNNDNGYKSEEPQINYGSSEYKDGYSDAINFRESRSGVVNGDSISYKAGYNNGINTIRPKINEAEVRGREDGNTGVLIDNGFEGILKKYYREAFYLVFDKNKNKLKEQYSLYAKEDFENDYYRKTSNIAGELRDHYIKELNEIKKVESKKYKEIGAKDASNWEEAKISAFNKSRREYYMEGYNLEKKKLEEELEKELEKSLLQGKGNNSYIVPDKFSRFAEDLLDKNNEGKSIFVKRELTVIGFVASLILIVYSIRFCIRKYRQNK